jgi:hypothetical protein
MTIRKMRHKNPVVYACQWTGENTEELLEFAGTLIDLPNPNNENKLSVYSELSHDWKFVPIGHYVVKQAPGIFDSAAPSELEDADDSSLRSGDPLDDPNRTTAEARRYVLLLPALRYVPGTEVR